MPPWRYRFEGDGKGSGFKMDFLGQRSEKIGNDWKRIGLSNPDLFSKSLFSRFSVDFGGVLGGFWEVFFVLFSKTSIL